MGTGPAAGGPPPRPILHFQGEVGSPAGLEWLRAVRGQTRDVEAGAVGGDFGLIQLGSLLRGAWLHPGLLPVRLMGSRAANKVLGTASGYPSRTDPLITS